MIYPVSFFNMSAKQIIRTNEYLYKSVFHGFQDISKVSANSIRMKCFVLSLTVLCAIQVRFSIEFTLVSI